MTFSFSIDNSNFLDYHLYMADRSKVIIRKRRSSQYFFSIIYIILGIFFFENDRPDLGISFTILGLLWFIFFPKLNKKSRKRFYANYISENYRKRVRRTTEMTIENEFIFVNDGVSESKISVSEFEQLIETPKCFFLKLKIGTSYIIPKENIDSNLFRSEIEKLKIPLLEENSWKW